MGGENVNKLNAICSFSVCSHNKIADCKKWWVCERDGCTLALILVVLFMFLYWRRFFEHIQAHRYNICVSCIIHTNTKHTHCTFFGHSMCCLNLHMLRMFTDAFDELIGLEFTDANVMDGREQWESIRKKERWRNKMISQIIIWPKYPHFLNNNTHLSSNFLVANMKFTSFAVGGPCNFWPFNISVSNCSIVLPLVTNASDTLRLRPPVIANERISFQHSFHWQNVDVLFILEVITHHSMLWSNQQHHSFRRMFLSCLLGRIL